MGYFSELVFSEDTNQRQDGFEAFAPAPNAIDGTTETVEIPEVSADDEGRQRAEAEAAPAVLAMLNEQVGEAADAGEEPEQADEPQPTEDEKKKAHEESEAKRRAEWEAKQAAKKAAEEKALQELASMSEDCLLYTSPSPRD